MGSSGMRSGGSGSRAAAEPAASIVHTVSIAAIPTARHALPLPPRRLPAPASTGATGPIIGTAPRNIGFVTFPKTTAVNYSFTDAPTPPFVPVAPQGFGVRPGE